MTTIANPAHIHVYAAMIAGVTSVGPSHRCRRTAPRKFDAGERDGSTAVLKPVDR